jgi:hypothetical protein
MQFLHKIKRVNQSKRIIEPVGNDLLSRNEMNPLDMAMQLFSGKPLVELSHEYPEWKRYKELFDNKLVSMRPININDFFENPDINNSPNIKNISAAIRFTKALNILRKQENSIWRVGVMPYSISPQFTFYGYIPDGSDELHIGIVLNAQDSIVKYCYCT